YCLRQKDQKRHAVKALKRLNYYTVAVGDSYNDISMLQEADHGIFFRPTEKIACEYPDFPVTHEFDALKNELEQLNK
ncbi:MAG: HAD hydrolase family protein, partial [SAR324 cluster bacterium]|nr:HAD hydrolase family protein [SAR324 cluster bacterium]